MSSIRYKKKDGPPKRAVSMFPLAKRPAV
jgi:hypothetical protein